MQSYFSIRNTNIKTSNAAIWETAGITASDDPGAGTCFHNPVE